MEVILKKRIKWFFFLKIEVQEAIFEVQGKTPYMEQLKPDMIGPRLKLYYPIKR